MESLENRELLSVAPWDVPAEPANETASVATSVTVAEAPTPAVDLSTLNAAPNVDSALATGTAPLVVTTNLDVVDPYDGVTSLREAIAAAPVGATITFDAGLKGQTIRLSGSQLDVFKGITVDANALYDAETQTPGIVVDANGRSRAFLTSGGTDARPTTLKGLAITNGYIAGYGGGVYAFGATNFENCSFVDNAALYGGGVYVYGTATFTNCAITDNAAVWGGGAFAFGSATLTNSLVAENLAANGGGGLYVAGNATIRNATIAANEADWGAGMQVTANGTAKIYNTILATNEGGDLVGGARLNAYNVLSGHKAWNAGSNNIVYDASAPLFTDASNGDYTLSTKSQASHKGNNAYAVDAWGNKLTTDLAGEPRVFGSVVDLGAYEGDSVPEPTLEITGRDVYSLTIDIGAVEGATKYVVEYTSENSGFKEGFTDVKYYATARSYTLTNLTPNTRYWVRVKAIVGGVESEWAPFQTQRTTPEPIVPVQLETPTITAATRDTSSLTITIGEVENASSYRLTYSTNAAFTDAKTVVATAGENTLSGLNANARYFVKARAIGDGTYYLNSVYSAYTSARTAAPPRLETPTIAAATRDASSLTITVGEVENAIGYTLTYSKSASFEDAQTTSVTVGENTLSGLDASVRYYVKVMAIGDETNYRSSDYSAYASARTAAAPVKLAAPTIAAATRDVSSLTITIGEVENAVGYVLTYATDAAFTDAKAISVNVGENTLSDLASNTRYYVKAMAIGAGANYLSSDYSAYASARTAYAPKGPTPALNVEARGASGLTLTIGYLSGAPSYVVEYSTDPDFESDVATRVFSSSGVKKLSNLTPNTTYYVRVKGGETGEWSVAQTAATNPLHCAAPTLSIVQRDAQSHTVTVGFSSGASSYTMEYSTDPTFATYSTKTFASNGAKKFADFPTDSTVYVRVKAEGTGAYVDSTYSDAVLVLGKPTFTLAQRGTDATSLTVTLDYVAGATNYVVEYSTDATFATYATREFSSNGSKKLGGLTAGTTYFVRVTAFGADGNVCSFVSATQSQATYGAASSAAVSDAFADLFAEESEEDDFWFELEEALENR